MTDAARQGLLFRFDGQAAYRPGCGSGYGPAAGCGPAPGPGYGAAPGRDPARGRGPGTGLDPAPAVDPPAARERPTSVGAGRRIRLSAKTFRAQVHEALRAGPKTDEEICRATGLRGSTVRPRRLELLREGLIEDSGRVRPTRSGRDAIVWRLKEAGEEMGCRSS